MAPLAKRFVEVPEEEWTALNARLHDAEEKLRAVQSGAVDALLIDTPQGPKVYVLQSADHPYRVLVERMHEAALTLSEGGSILYANSRFSELVQTPPREVLGRAFADFVTERDAAMLQNLIAEAKSMPMRGECSLRQEDASTLPVQIALSGVSTADFEGLCAIVTDLTDHYRMREIIASERVTRSILDQSTDAILLCDVGGRVRQANRAAVELFGHGVVGRALGSICEDKGEFARAIETGTPVRSVVTQCTGPHGCRLDLMLSAKRLASDEGENLGWVVSITDVTTLKAAESLLRQADRRKDEFLAMLAHEFRNPLAPIRNAVEVMRLIGPADAALNQAREIIARQVDHLARLVDDLLDVSRITQGKINLRQQPVDVNSIFSGAVEIVRPFVDERRHTLVVRPLAQPATVKGDYTRLVQIVGNLLNNAAKYTEPGGEISVAAEIENDMVVIRVADNGTGIASDLLPHVFDLFTQADRTSERAQGGLGIGLSLVRNLVSMHGGSVEVRSEGPHKGSEFTVRLPLSEASSAPEPAVQPGIRARAPCRLVVIDDNRDAAESMAMLLRLQGHETHVAFDGQSGVSLAREVQPDCVLVDIGLPGIDGYEVARLLRAGESSGRMTLIALTGYGQAGDKLRSARAGFDHHLVKPVPQQVLDQLIQRCGSESGT